jgi:hypothetical protein
MPSDDDLRRRLRARLTDGSLFGTVGVSTVRQATGRPCHLCGRKIDPPDMERQVDGPGICALAHEPCYKLWHEESMRAG